MSQQTKDTTAIGANGAGLFLELHVEERNVVDYLRTFEDEEVRNARAVEALKVGVIAIQSASPTLDTTVVQGKFDDMEDKLTEFLNEFMKEVKDDLAAYFKDKDGVVPRSINGVFGEDGKLGRTFQQFFDPADGKLGQLMQHQIGPTSMFGRALDPKNKDGILAQIEGRVQQMVEAKLDEVLGEFSLDNEESAMCRLNKLLFDSFSQINQTLGVKTATALEADRGHVKGMEFEEQLYQVFAKLGLQLGDETELVRGMHGTLRRKTGDFVATLGETAGAPGLKLVVESKDQAVKLKAAIDELLDAKENREASVGIYVFAKGQEPAEVGDFRRIGEDFFCTVDKDDLSTGKQLPFFEAAVKIARALAVTAARKDAAGAFDVQKVKDHIDTLIESSSRLGDILTKARTVRASGESIEKAADALKKDLESRLSDVQQLLQLGSP